MLRSWLYAHFQESLTGIPTIKASVPSRSHTGNIGLIEALAMAHFRCLFLIINTILTWKTEHSS
jgi:hypothetical protein